MNIHYLFISSLWDCAMVYLLFRLTWVARPLFATCSRSAPSCAASSSIRNARTRRPRRSLIISSRASPSSWPPSTQIMPSTISLFLSGPRPYPERTYSPFYLSSRKSQLIFNCFFCRDVKVYVRDKNYSNNCKNNLEKEVSLKIFIFIQNINALIIFHWKKGNFKYKTYFLLIFGWFLRIIFVTNKQFNRPTFLSSIDKSSILIFKTQWNFFASYSPLSISLLDVWLDWQVMMRCIFKHRKSEL